MAETFDQELEIGGDERLVLDDHDPGGRNLLGDLAVGLIDEAGDVLRPRHP